MKPILLLIFVSLLLSSCSHSLYNKEYHFVKADGEGSVIMKRFGIAGVNKEDQAGAQDNTGSFVEEKETRITRAGSLSLEISKHEIREEPKVKKNAMLRQGPVLFITPPKARANHDFRKRMRVAAVITILFITLLVLMNSGYVPVTTLTTALAILLGIGALYFALMILAAIIFLIILFTIKK